MSPILEVYGPNCSILWTKPYLLMKPLKERSSDKRFMLNQTRETDIAMFMNIARIDEFQGPESVPFSTLVPAFIPQS
ncbi:MAG: hypothetical protein CM15mP58_21720 [Burkholderiaceae bacterium]|nr:MAG: hypothetical protein CM15mP58_21720 [Burkholderiaceae bacterium]